MTRRRSFLKIGAASAIALAFGGAVYRQRNPPSPARPFMLDGAAHGVLAAVVPAMLASALPDDPTARADAVTAATARVRDAILALPLATQKEIEDLFGLLSLGPARRWLAGLSSDWDGATPQQVHDFLQSWRTHRLATLQIAYLALHDLILGAWYADPSTWVAIGYPGPLKELLA
jgi:hypothetical protein